MSIDSHFEVTENKEDSVRLHLPNYKGNQPMDFHIYLMEPFLFISFVTEVEGEKVTVLNNYHQDTDQQDMFNMAMASNLDRMHQVMEGKYKKDDNEQNSSCKQGEYPAAAISEETHTSCTEEKIVNWKNLKEVKSKVVDPYVPINTSTDYEGRLTSTKNNKSFRRKKNTKPTPSHYQAVVVDMLIAIVIGFYVYNSGMILLEQNRDLFLGMCLFLAIVSWGYPYFETSVKIDNDKCFEQGCIHPIIGVFGVLFFPLFIHYWLYKGIKACFIRLNGVVKRKQDVKKKDKEIKKRTHEQEEYRRLQKIEDEKIEQERQKWLEENHRKAVERNERLNKLREHFKEVDAENEYERSTYNHKL